MKSTFRIGQSVRICRGPFEGRVGTVLSIESIDTIKVQFGALKVVVPLTLLAPNEDGSLVSDPPKSKRKKGPS